MTIVEFEDERNTFQPNRKLDLEKKELNKKRLDRAIEDIQALRRIFGVGYGKNPYDY